MHFADAAADGHSLSISLSLSHLPLSLTWSMCLSSKPLRKAALWVFLLLEEPTPRLPTPPAFPMLRSKEQGEEEAKGEEECFFLFALCSPLSCFSLPQPLTAHGASPHHHHHTHTHHPPQKKL